MTRLSQSWRRSTWPICGSDSQGRLTSFERGVRQSDRRARRALRKSLSAWCVPSVQRLPRRFLIRPPRVDGVIRIVADRPGNAVVHVHLALFFCVQGTRANSAEDADLVA